MCVKVIHQGRGIDPAYGPRQGAHSLLSPILAGQGAGQLALADGPPRLHRGAQGAGPPGTTGGGIGLPRRPPPP